MELLVNLLKWFAISFHCHPKFSTWPTPAYTTPSLTNTKISFCLNLKLASLILRPFINFSFQLIGLVSPFLKKNILGLSNSATYTIPSLSTLTIVNVEYATFLTAHIGNVFIIVSTTSSISIPSFNIVRAILAVKVANILALTPLPKPSDKTATNLSLSL